MARTVRLALPPVAPDYRMTSPAPRPQPGEYSPGEMIPGTVYRVLSCIGKGGMGRVYEVVDTSIDAHYAVKVLLPSALVRHDLVERMRAEARVLGRLRSKYIVRVFTAGVAQDRVPYFVMDVLRGKPLSKVIRQHKGRKLPLDTARNLMVGIFLGLERAHEQGVVHRDIKPENVLVVMDQEDPTGPTYPVIVDFGIMSLLNEQKRITGGNQFLGTPGQASPEQCKGERASPPNDIYAAGLLLYQLVAGRHPFADEIKSGSLREIFAAHLVKLPPPPTDFEPSIDSELEHLIMSCLDKDPLARPTATECVKELNRLIRLCDAETDERNTTQDMLVGEVHDAVEQTRVEQEIALGIADVQRAGQGPAARKPMRNDATDPSFDEPPVEGAAPETAAAEPAQAPPRRGPSGTIRMALPADASGSAKPVGIDRLALTQTSPVAAPAIPRIETTDPLFDDVLRPASARPPVEHIIAAMPRRRGPVDEYDTTLKSEEEPAPRRHRTYIRAYRGLLGGVAIGTAVAALTVAGITYYNEHEETKPASTLITNAPTSTGGEQPITPAPSASTMPVAESATMTVPSMQDAAPPLVVAKAPSPAPMPRPSSAHTSAKPAASSSTTRSAPGPADAFATARVPTAPPSTGMPAKLPGSGL